MAAKGIIVAIDGPSGAGKSTVARRVAELLGYMYVDSGAMYRAVALIAAERQIPITDPQRLASCAAGLRIELEKAGTSARVRVDGWDVTEALRRPGIGQAASVLATLGEVRAVLVEQQQRQGAAGGIVMEGRDIGSVVFPRAEMKVFLDASLQARARRRFQQQREMGIDSSPEKTQAEVEERDRRDAGRSVSPLVQAPDAVYLDTTALSAEDAAAVIVRLAQQRAARKKSEPVT